MPPPREPIGTAGGVPVFSGHGPGHAGTSDPALVLDESVDSSASYEVQGLYRRDHQNLWSGYPSHAALVADGAGDALVPDAGLDVIPLHGKLTAPANAVVRAQVRPKMSLDRHGRRIVLFEALHTEVLLETARVERRVRTFHARHLATLKALAERESGMRLPPFASPLEFTPGYEVATGRLSFSVSAAEPLGYSFTLHYVCSPPYDGVTEVWVSSLFLGE